MRKARGQPAVARLHVRPATAWAGHAGWSALWQLVTCGVLDAIAEPDPDGPQCRENAAEKVHGRHHGAGGNDEYLKQAAAGQRDPEQAACECSEHDCGDGSDASRQSGCMRRQVVDLHGDRDRQAKHDGLHDQHRGAQPLHWESPSSPGSSEPESGQTAPFPAVSDSRTRASPAVITEPVMRTPAFPGPPSPAASASSASATPISIASSSGAATVTRSGPKTGVASAASASAGIDRVDELVVATRWAATGSSSPRMPATSLSSLTAMMATRSVKLNASVSASADAAMPPGLCAESRMTTGLRRMISSRPGEVIVATARLTMFWSTPAAPAPGSSSASGVRANASTAAIAQARLPAWYAPNSGR